MNLFSMTWNVILLYLILMYNICTFITYLLPPNVILHNKQTIFRIPGYLKYAYESDELLYIYIFILIIIEIKILKTKNGLEN